MTIFFRVRPMSLARLVRYVVCALIVGFASAAEAAPLAPGGFLFPVPGEPDPGPSALVDFMSQPFSGAPLFSGVLNSTVLSDPANPLAGLTFVYEISNDLVSLDSIGRLTINSFAGWLVDASYQIPAVNLSPSLVDRSVAGTIGFRFQDQPPGSSGVLAPGMTSALLVLETNAPAYTTTFASVINGTVATAPTFSPIPEPAGIVLLASGSCALASFAYRWRRRAGSGAVCPGRLHSEP
jgi:hypothetical protein